jgi:hypothetical protein
VGPNSRTFAHRPHYVGAIFIADQVKSKSELFALVAVFVTYLLKIFLSCSLAKQFSLANEEFCRLKKECYSAAKEFYSPEKEFWLAAKESCQVGKEL